MTLTSNLEAKVAVLGDGAVGKTALTLSFVSDKFLWDYDPTIEDTYRKTVEIDDNEVTLDILDTAGQEEFACMQDLWIRESNGFLLVYSITSPTSFKHIQTIHERILRLKDIDWVPIVLIGNKCDLNDDRKIPEIDGKNLSNKWDCVFMETSAKNKINNKECFYELYRQIHRFDDYDKQHQIPQSQNSCECKIL